jgi:hypothetical protein
MHSPPSWRSDLLGALTLDSPARRRSARPEVSRQSFAVYYYTREAPGAIAEPQRSTLFRARPEEKRKRYVDMPLEKALVAVDRSRRKAVRAVRSLWQRDPPS